MWKSREMLLLLGFLALENILHLHSIYFLNQKNSYIKQCYILTERPYNGENTVR